jgi:hypothetical protein
VSPCTSFPSALVTAYGRCHVQRGDWLVRPDLPHSPPESSPTHGSESDLPWRSARECQEPTWKAPRPPPLSLVLASRSEPLVSLVSCLLSLLSLGASEAPSTARSGATLVSWCLLSLPRSVSLSLPLSLTHSPSKSPLGRRPGSGDRSHRTSGHGECCRSAGLRRRASSSAGISVAPRVAGCDAWLKTACFAVALRPRVRARPAPTCTARALPSLPPGPARIGPADHGRT